MGPGRRRPTRPGGGPPALAPALRAQRRAPLAVDPLHGLRRPRGGRGAAGPPRPRRRPEAARGRGGGRPSDPRARRPGRPVAVARAAPGYGNAVVPEVLVLGGHLLGEDVLLAEGLALLEWLLENETRDGHLSVAPVDGWTLGEPRPGFDQQPIEAARSRTPAPPRSGSRATSGGSTASNGRTRGSSATTTRACRCTTRPPAAASTGWKPTAATRTRAPSRPSPSSRPCNRGAHRTTRPCLTVSRRSRWPPGAHYLRADPRRIITNLFVAGHEMLAGGESPRPMS